MNTQQRTSEGQSLAEERLQLALRFGPSPEDLEDRDFMDCLKEITKQENFPTPTTSALNDQVKETI